MKFGLTRTITTRGVAIRVLCADIYLAFLEGELQRMWYRGAHSRPIGYAAMLKLVRADARHAAAIRRLHAQLAK